jgi:hypothetical protein
MTLAETVYVSPSGHNNNKGDSPSSAVKTLAEAMKRAEPGREAPLTICLEGGRAYQDQCFGSVGCYELDVVAHHGRAVVVPPVGEPGLFRYGGGGSQDFVMLGLLGVDFTAGNRGDGKDTAAAMQWGGGGLLNLGDTRVAGFATGINVNSEGKPLAVVGSPYVANCYCSSSHSNGMYIEHAAVMLDNPVVEYNGYSLINGVPATPFNHGMYIKTRPGFPPLPVMIRGGAFRRNSSHGLQIRGGGVVSNVIFDRNPIAWMAGRCDDPSATGTTTHFADCRMVQGADIDGAERGWGGEIGNSTNAIFERCRWQAAAGANEGPGVLVRQGGRTDAVGTARLRFDTCRFGKGWRGPHIDVEGPLVLEFQRCNQRRIRVEGDESKVEIFAS